MALAELHQCGEGYPKLANRLFTLVATRRYIHAQLHGIAAVQPLIKGDTGLDSKGLFMKPKAA